MVKNVLVTGGAGFVAHHVIEVFLQRTDYNIVCLDRLDYSGNLNRLQDMMNGFDKETQKRLRIVFHDLRAEVNSQVKRLLGDVNIILHLAAGSHVDRSIEYPMEFVQDNVIGTVNLLQYAREVKNLERLVYFSTDEVFGPAPEGVFYEERARYNSTNPYSAAKAAGEEMCVAFENTYGLPIYITHTMNVFGERQHPEKFIPQCIKRVRDGEMLTIHSDSSKTKPGSRHYIHAKDVADALLFLLSREISVKPDFGGAKCPKFNIVGKEEVDNLELAQLIAKCQNKKLNYQMVDFHSSRPGHDLRYSLSGDYMKELGWEPKVRLSERIIEVVNWSLNNKDWLDQ